MLDVNNLTAGYGDIVAVRDFSFSLEPGNILALMGANGAGKTSALMSVMGLVERKSGSISIDGIDISQLSVESRISLGIAIVPEGRRIFPDLSVEENLVVGGHGVKKSRLKKCIEKIYGYFPILGERKKQSASSLSGGEQQMLAMGRGLVSDPKILIVDELSLGLMPKVVDECYRVIQHLKSNGTGFLLVEQNTERAFANADFVSILEAGDEIWSGRAKDASKDPTLKEKLLGK